MNRGAQEANEIQMLRVLRNIEKLLADIREGTRAPTHQNVANWESWGRNAAPAQEIRNRNSAPSLSGGNPRL